MTTLNHNLKKQLIDTGFSPREADVYLAALELGSSTVWDIYKKSGIKRSTCYLILENFVKNGYASKVPSKKSIMFSVIEPRNLLGIYRKREEYFRNSLPMFDALASKSKAKPSIQLFEGHDGVKQAYDIGLNHASDEILIFGNADIWLKYDEQNREYIAKRKKQNLKLRVLFSDDRNNRLLAKSDKSDLRESRFLPKSEYNPSMETQIIGDIVLFIASSESEPYAYIIKSINLAQDEKEKFELLWSLAHKSKK